ncbi:Rsc58 protein [Martiniozyma asiatica (nom. inval.)]|nr:Rsc58 protein [Martiniozyma asiatica]
MEKKTANLVDIWSQIDPCDILTTNIPKHDVFFEPNAQNITFSFLNYLDNKKEFKKTTIKSSKYKGIYDLYHDLKCASILKINEYQDQTAQSKQMYQFIDRFYRVTTEMLLREAVQFGIDINEEMDNGKENSNSEEFDVNVDKISKKVSELGRQFEMISNVIYQANGQAISIFTGPNMPFFSSLSKQSELDDREAMLDIHNGVNSIKVLPSIPPASSLEPSKQALKPDLMGHLSISERSGDSKMVLDNYMHPNWLRLMDAQWLKHGESIREMMFTFAPVFDEGNVVISNEWRGKVWCQQVGFEKLLKIKNASSGQTNDLATVNNSNSKNSNLEFYHDPQENVKTASTQGKIDVGKILTLGNYPTDGDIESVQNNNVQKTISKLILQLSELRQGRKRSKVSKVGPREKQLYQRAQRLLAGLVSQKRPQQVALDPRIAVLTHSYAGVLPDNWHDKGIEKSGKRSKRW